MNKTNIFFLGCGKMGKIIANNLIKNNIYSANDFLILKPTNDNKIEGLKYIDSFDKIPQNYVANIVFICIKPQNSQKILQQLKDSKIYSSNTIFVSILAGKETDFFLKIFGQSTKIVRAMPNIAIEVNHGIIPLYFYNCLAIEKDSIKNIFANCGYAFEVLNQELFHPLTALFGCGPAYIFLMQEIFKNLTINQQIPAEIAHKLVQELFLGTSLISANNNIDFSDLRSIVTSKKGVTASALKVLIKNNKLQNLITKTINSGIKKSQRLTIK
jgi:pyrroline-5-carboxylate reductase